MYRQNKIRNLFTMCYHQADGAKVLVAGYFSLPYYVINWQ